MKNRNCIYLPDMRNIGIWAPFWISNGKINYGPSITYLELVYEKTMQNLKFRPEAKFEKQIYIICVLKDNM